jgi:hypothetical protein
MLVVEAALVKQIHLGVAALVAVVRLDLMP